LPGTNALAYYEKSFITLATAGDNVLYVDVESKKALVPGKGESRFGNHIIIRFRLTNCNVWLGQNQRPAWVKSLYLKNH
jgi:hypothetical protein